MTDDTGKNSVKITVHAPLSLYNHVLAALFNNVKQFDQSSSNSAKTSTSTKQNKDANVPSALTSIYCSNSCHATLDTSFGTMRSIALVQHSFMDGYGVNVHKNPISLT